MERNRHPQVRMGGTGRVWSLQTLRSEPFHRPLSRGQRFTLPAAGAPAARLPIWKLSRPPLSGTLKRRSVTTAGASTYGHLAQTSWRRIWAGRRSPARHIVCGPARRRSCRPVPVDQSSGDTCCGGERGEDGCGATWHGQPGRQAGQARLRWKVL